MNILRKGVVSITGTVILGAVNLLIGILLARSLGPEQLGQYEVVIATALLVSAIGSIGVGNAAIYFINNLKTDNTVVTTTLARFACVMSPMCFIALMLALQTRSYFGAIDYGSMMAISAYASLLAFVTILWPVLMADRQVIRYSLVSVAPRVALLALLVAAMLFGLLSLSVAWLCIALGQIAALILTLLFVRARVDLRAPRKPRLLRQMAVYGSKLNLAYVLSIVNVKLGILLLGLFLPEQFAQTGFYSRAVGLGSVALLGVHAVGPLLYSKWSGARAQERRAQLERVCRVLLTVCLVMSAGVLALAPYIVRFLYGNSFLPSVPLLRIVTVGVAAQFLTVPHFRLYAASGAPHLTSAILAVTILVMACTMALLVPSLLAVGAAAAYSIANGVGLTLTLALSYSRFHVGLGRCLFINRADVNYVVHSIRPIECRSLVSQPR